MFSRADYLLPVVGAQRQYRAVHYGLTAAALLEDVFTDAVSFYVRQFEPEHTFERSARGEAEIDYVWDGQPMSHKSGLGPTPISVLWDATVQRDQGWTSRYPVTYLSTGYFPTNGAAQLADNSFIELTSMFRANGIPKQRGQTVVLIRWEADGTAEVLLRGVLTPDHEVVGDVFAFDEIWHAITRQIFDGRPANEIEILRTRSRLSEAQEQLVEPGCRLLIDFELRSGVYVIPLSAMTDVPLAKNNRGQLLAKETVVGLLGDAQKRGLFVPMPLWYTHFAPPRPPDTFLPLRADLDNRFSANRTADGTSDE